MLQIGIKGHLEKCVEDQFSAKKVGSGELEVLSTPMMIALIEETAWKSTAPYLEEGTTTVGTKIDISHLSATPIGLNIICDTELIEIDNRRLVFKVNVRDEKTKIGEGIHERFIVNKEKFIEKTKQKLL